MKWNKWNAEPEDGSLIKLWDSLLLRWNLSHLAQTTPLFVLFSFFDILIFALDISDFKDEIQDYILDEWNYDFA